MALSVSEAVKLVQSELIRGIGMSVVTEDEFLFSLPFVTSDRHLIEWNVEASLGTAAGFIAAGGTVNESAATFAMSGAYIERIADDVLVPNSIASNYAMQDQVAIQIQKKAKKLGRAIGNALINGTGIHATPDIRGLAAYCGASQTRSAVASAGDVFALSIMDELALTYLKVRNNAVYVMNSQLYTKFLAALRAAGGITLADYQGTMRPFYGQYPVLRSDWIPNTEVLGSSSNLSSIYMVSFDEVEGAALYATEHTPVPDSLGAEGMFEVLNVGQDPSTDNQKYRLGTNVALVIKSPLAIARAKNIVTA